MTRISRTRELDADAIARLCAPRDDVVGERLADDTDGTDHRIDGSDGTRLARFVQDDGPFARYERLVEVDEPTGVRANGEHPEGRLTRRTGPVRRSRSMTRQANAPCSSTAGRVTKATYRPSALIGATPYDTW